MSEKIYQNAIYIPEIDHYIASWNSHDYAGHAFSDGKEYYIDGGLSYFRRAGDFNLISEGRVIEYSLTEQTPKEEIYNKLLWGTRGKNGDEPLKYKPISTFTLEHLQAMEKNCGYAPEIVKETVRYWIDKYLNK